MDLAQKAQEALRILYGALDEDLSADYPVSDLEKELGLEGMEIHNLLIYMKDKGWIKQRGTEVVALEIPGIEEAKRIG